MFRKIAYEPIPSLITAAVVLLTLTGATPARADDKPENWSINLSSSEKGLKVDVYDVVKKSYVVKDKNFSGSISVSALAKKGGGWEANKVGAHLRWSATRGDRCWWGQACATRNGASTSVGPLRQADSVAAGNCHITGETPACGNSN